MLHNQRFCTIVAAAIVCGIVFSGHPASAQTQIQAGQFIISELRLRGPVGAEDEFVELYNNTDQPITVQALDASGGWTVAVSNGQITGPLFTIPNGTIIPARGHLLGANTNGYSLSGYPSGNPTPTPSPSPLPAILGAPVPNVAVGSPFATATPDRTWDFDAPDGSGIALFATTNGMNFTAATRLDAFGYTGSPALYREGAGFPTVVTSGLEHTYYRDLRNGTPRDTADNAADFLLVGTATNLQITRLGAPGPENLASPIVNNTTITPTLLDSSVSASSPPNRERDFTGDLANNATFGTLRIRRTITNNTGLPLSRLRFRVVNITTVGTPDSECSGSPCADLRAATSQDGTAMTSEGQVVVLRGVRLEEPPAQPNGGGYNASLSADFITLATPLPDGQSINVEFKLGIMRTGPFRFFLNIEAQNSNIVVVAVDRPASGVDANGRTDFRKGRLIVDTVRSAPGTTVAPASPTAAPVAAPRTAYVPWLINLTPPTSNSTRAAEDETDRDDESKEKSSEEAPPSAQPAPQAPAASAPDSPADADDPAPQPSPATTRRDSSKKPVAAKAVRRGQQ
ncbi:MAG: hypothetical protein QOH49_5173 [Acidobacteriota bacterium]|jgi:hypothetical protein|nr:hypothetical protein [Acidobacteriota bacterium]